MLTVFLAIGAVGLALLVISLVVGEIHGGLFEWIDNDLFSGAAVSAFLSALGFVGALVESTSGNTTVATLAGTGAGAWAWRMPPAVSRARCSPARETPRCVPATSSATEVMSSRRFPAMAWAWSA